MRIGGYLTMENLIIERKILGFLSQQDPGSEFSLVQHKNQFYFSRFRPKAWSPSSSTIKLIQGIFDENKDLSFFILRNRIYTTEDLTPRIRNFVKLTAKRISQVTTQEVGASAPENLIEVGRPESSLFESRSVMNSLDRNAITQTHVESHEAASRLCRHLSGLILRGPQLHDYNRSVSALLVGPDSKLLSWSINLAALNKSLHAEVVLIQNYFRQTARKIPRGSRVYISLKPCVMCASFLKDACEDIEQTEFFYFEEDPGPRALGTELDAVLVRLNY